MNEWIQTYTGERFWPLDPMRGRVRIEDIAHAMSLMCRFGGHCKTFYSVAEHSCRLSHLVPSGAAIHALLHDAAETYLGDVLSPMKHHFFLATFQGARRGNTWSDEATAYTPFRQQEHGLLNYIYGQLGLASPGPGHGMFIEEAHARLSATEVRDLMGVADVRGEWGLVGVPFSQRIVPWSAEKAEDVFLNRFKKWSAEAAS